MSTLLAKLLALFVGLGLTLSLAGCGLGLPTTGGPTAPCSVTNSKQAADRFLQRIENLSSTQGNTVTITATSQEISSVVNEFILQAKQNTPGGIMPLENPVVCFKNGQMSVYGTINPPGLGSLNALISVAAAVNTGKANFRVEHVEVGSFSVPQSLGDTISSLINESLNRSLAQIHLTEISIGNDQITLKGSLQ